MTQVDARASELLPELSEDMVQRLITAARGGMSKAYGVSSSDPHYGAAVLASSGEVYASGQYKSGTRNLSLHAEHAALVHAAAEGAHDIVAIAIISDEDPTGREFTNPCGVCKQALYENSLASGIPMRVILVNLQGSWAVKLLDELNAYPWPSR